MSTRVNRGVLIQHLEAVQPGLSPRDIVEQSSCFVFKNGRVTTFNDEVACRAKSHLPKEFVGAVTAKPLLDLLNKIPDEVINVDLNNGHMVVRGKRKEEGGVRIEKEITLPIDTIDNPGDWKPLHKNFSEAISIVQECAGRDESQFTLTCVHIHPKWVEACDNLQLTRYKIKTGVEKPILVKRDSLKPVATLDMTEFSETASWIHFRNPAGLIYSCRRHVEEYVDLMPLLELKEGEPVVLPKGLTESTGIASIFSSENADDNQVLVEMRTGKLRVKGVGASGYYFRIMKVNYEGKNIAFRVAPKLLMEITSRHNEAVISEDRLKVDGGKWIYVTCLGKPEAMKQKDEPQTEEEESGDAEADTGE